jgi:hypothetical protein
MTIARVKPANWGIGDTLTSADLNAVDTNATYALDKRGGQTDTLASVVTLAGAGRVIPTTVIGANADTSYQADGGNLVIHVTSAVTASRNYTLSNTNAVEGDILSVYADASFAPVIGLVEYTVTVKNAAGTALFVLGNWPAADGQYATFIYTVASGWLLLASNGGSRLRKVVCSGASTSWTCPPGVTSVMLQGYGGGGGGGAGGRNGAALTNASNSGGGGGGGSLVNTQQLAVTPGVTYTGVCGTGGTGGATAGANGVDGGDTLFKQGATVLATFCGAAGGRGGVLTTVANAGGVAVASGGSAIRSSVYFPAGTFLYSTANPIGAALIVAPAQGGYGNSAQSIPLASRTGGTNPANATGGAAGGADGALSGSYYGGGGGGGGAAGPILGTPGTGGAGGAGNGAGTGSNGTAGGNSVGTQTGGGGGGGGAPGQGSAGEGAIGAGGNGGSGSLTIIYVK